MEGGGALKDRKAEKPESLNIYCMAGALTARVFVFCSVFLLSLSLFAVAVPFNAYSDFQAQRIDTVYTIDVTPSQLNQFTTTRINDRGILDIGKNIVAGVKKKPRYISDGLPEGQTGASRPMMLPHPPGNSREEDLTYSQINQFQKKRADTRYCNGQDDDKQLVCSRCISPLSMNRVYYREGGFPIKESSEFELSARYIAQVCDQFEAPVYRDVCVSKVLLDEGVYPPNREVSGDISRELRAVRFGLMAWCDLTLWFTDGPDVRVVDHSTGSIAVSWNTSIISTSSVLIYNLSNPETDPFARPLIFNSSLTKEHNIAYSGLVSGTYRVAVSSAIQTPFDSRWQVIQGDYIDVAIYREGPPAPAVLSYIAPTPEDGGSLRNSSVTIAISSTQPLRRATLQWGSGPNARSYHQMHSSSSTEFTFTKTMLNIAPGNYVYRVTGIDMQGTPVEAPFRTLLVAPANSVVPLLTFAPPTPASGTALESDRVTIAIVSDTPLQSATLVATNPDRSISQMSMPVINSTSFALTFNGRAGTTTYYVRGLSTDNNFGETERRTVTLPFPVVNYFDSTPANGASVTDSDSVTVSVFSNEPLASATLVLSNGRSASSFPMSRTTSTQYTYTLNELLPDEYSFRVTALDEEGDQAETTTRSFTVTHVATPPVITFAPPTPVDSSTLVNDSLIVYVDSSESLASATLEVTNNGETRRYEMGGVSQMRFTLAVDNLYNGSVSFRVNAVDSQGDSGESETRVATVPITFQTHEFQGEAIWVMAVFGDYMYVGTYNVTVPGQGKVWRSTDAVNWEPVFYANYSNWVGGVITTVTGVFAMTTYNDGTGEALYVGTGAFLNGAGDGDIYRSYDGTHWERFYHNEDQLINRLTVIDDTLYVATRARSGGGHLLRYNARGWDLPINLAGEVYAVEKFNGQIYYSTDWGVYQLGVWRVISPQSGLVMKTYYNKLYMGTGDLDGNVLLKTRNPTTWQVENIPDSTFITNLRELSDGYLYLPAVKLDGAKLWRKNAAGLNQLIVDYSPKDATKDIVEFNGRKYVGINDHVDDSLSNRWGYIYKLTDNNARDTSTPSVEDRWIWSAYRVVTDLWRDWRGVQNSPWQYMYFQSNATRVNMTQMGICYGAGECWASGEATDQTLAAQDRSDVLIQVGYSGGMPHPNLAFRYYLTQFGNYTINGTASDRGGGDSMNYTVFVNNREICSGLITISDINCNLGTEIEAGSYVEVAIGSNANSNSDLGHLTLTVYGSTGRLDSH